MPSSRFCFLLGAIVAVAATALFVSASAAIALAAGGALMCLFCEIRLPGSGDDDRLSECVANRVAARVGRRTQDLGGGATAVVQGTDTAMPGETQPSASVKITSTDASPATLPTAARTLRFVRRPLKKLMVTPPDEHPHDAQLHTQRMARGKEPDWKEFYTARFNAALEAAASENTTRDPHIRPVGETGGCKR
jgi:hypothetical protein